MEFRILGPTEVLDNGEPIPLPKGRARSLLGLLVLRAGEVVSTDRLIDELWGESPPPTVGTALQGLVSSLRKRLEPDRDRAEPPMVLVTRGYGYQLAIDPGVVDANRFRRLLVEAAQAHAEHAAELLRGALDLWRGPALADFTFEPFAQVEIAELEELRLTALEKRIEADLAIGRHREVIGELERLVAEHPLREAVRRLLMLAMYRSGRQAEALQVYADLRRTLVEELGLDPAPSLRQLEELILRQDRSLDLEPVTRSNPSVAPRWIADERKMVTILSVDVIASIGEGDAPDAEVSSRALEKFFRKATAVVIGHGGQAEVVIGDALVGTFGVPTAREDDALRAVRSAVDLRHLLAAYNAELGSSGHVQLIARIGVDTGEAVISSASHEPAGDPVRGARKLHQRAGAGEILVGETTRLLIGKSVLVESLDVNRSSLRHSAWRVLDLVPGIPALPLNPETAIVGREKELSQLTNAFRRVAQEGRSARLVVLGDPGVGKSRLAREVAETIGTKARVVTGHCLSYGEGVAFWPVRQILAGLAGQIEARPLIDLMDDETDAESIARRLVDAFGPEPVKFPGSLFPLFRRFFEATARRRPVVLILEDLHWAQPTFLDLLEYLTESAHSPLFLLGLARPELLEVRPSFVEGPRAGSLRLGPLSQGESRKLAGNRLGGRMVPTEMLRRILESAQGNPLFVEQLLAAIGEEGEFVIPATLQALLTARIDRLGPAERDLIRLASVLGHRFSVATLLSLLPEPARPHALSHIRTLERKDLMHPLVDSRKGEGLGFRHVLIQQAAYRSMTMETRAMLHERAGARLEAEAGEDRDQAEEAIGYHLERAYEYRQKLDQVDEHARSLAIRAGEKLASTGLRAFSRFDAAGAENLLNRAIRLLPPEHSAQREVRFRLSEAYETMGRHGDADSVLSELLAEETGSFDAKLALELERVRVRFAVGPDPMTLDSIADLAAAALAHFEKIGDEGRMAQALFVSGEVHRRRGKIAEMEEVMRNGLAHADRSDNGREQLGARRMLATALEVGPTPVLRCIQECEDLALWRGTNNGAVLPILAHLVSMIGDFDRGRALIIQSEKVLREQNRAHRPLVLLRKRHAEVEVLANDLEAAEYQLRQALQLGLEMETREETAEIAALLSRVLFQRNTFDEAETMAELSRAQAPSESVTAQALWRSTRALTLAVAGRIEDAARLARAAIALVPPAMLSLRGDLHMDFARVLTLGQDEAARAVIEEAIASYKQKGNLVLSRGLT